MLKGQAKAKAVSATNPVKAKPHMNVPSPHRRVGVNKNFEVHAGIERASVTEGPSCYSACGRWMGLAWKWNRQTVGLREMQMERINIHQNTVCGFLPRVSNYFIQIHIYICIYMQISIIQICKAVSVVVWVFKICGFLWRAPLATISSHMVLARMLEESRLHFSNSRDWDWPCLSTDIAAETSG